MKTKLFFLMILSGCALYAQDKNKAEKDSVKTEKDGIILSTLIKVPKECPDCGDYDLIYDFACKKFYWHDRSKRNQSISGNNYYVYPLKDLNDVKLKYKKEFRFKIINLNKYLYGATVSYDNVFLESTQGDLFTNLFTGSGIELGKIAFGNASAALGGSGDPSFNSRKRNEIIDKLAAFQKEYKKLEQNLSKAHSLCYPTGICCDTISGEEYYKLSTSLNNLKNSLSDYITENKVDSKGKEIYLQQQNDSLTLLKTKLGKATGKAEIKTLTKLVNTTLDNIVQDEKRAEYLRNDTTKAEALLAILNTITDEKLLEMVHFANNLLKSNFEYVAPTIYPTGNQLDLTVKINRITSEQASKWQRMPIDNDEFHLNLNVCNKWFYSFSTGPFVGLSNNFRVDTFGWQKLPHDNTVDSDSKYKLVPTGRDGMPVGIAAFANFGTKLSDYYGVGASIGAGATILNDTRIAYFVGLSQFFGQEKQFNFTAGLSFIQINELNRELFPDLENEYDAPVELDYTKKFATGWFVSLSYSIFSSSNSKSGSSTNSSPEADTAE